MGGRRGRGRGRCSEFAKLMRSASKIRGGDKGELSKTLYNNRTEKSISRHSMCFERERE